jgi:hypothetical protein
MTRIEGDDHLAAIRERQHELIAHLKEPSVLHEIVRAVEDGPVNSKSALFMLHLIDGAFNRLEGDPS